MNRIILFNFVWLNIAQIKIDKLSNYTFITKLYLQTSNTKCTLHTHTHRCAPSLKHNRTHTDALHTDTDTLIQIRQHTNTDTLTQKYTHRQLFNTQATSDINELDILHTM